MLVRLDDEPVSTSSDDALERAEERMTESTPDLTLAILREIRTELRDHRALLLSLTEFTRRLDRRIDHLDRRFSEVKDDLELTIKVELMGSLAHRDTLLDERLERLSDRIAAVEAR
ncbi:hypothetical protein [Methylobacterium oryzisoli]|uniref:hypothetical protein n=1 Tax=Methylobacterium oryzisoli TaxID=3385502 RepID=UPI003892C37D